MPLGVGVGGLIDVQAWSQLVLQSRHTPGLNICVDPGGPVVIILASGSEVRMFDPGQGQWIFSECKNPEYDFLRKECKAMGLVSQIYAT